MLKKNALQNVKVKETDEYKAVAEERDMLRALGGDDFSSVKPKFRETVYKMLERGENAPAIAEQLKQYAENTKNILTRQNLHRHPLPTIRSRGQRTDAERKTGSTLKMCGA